MSHQKRRVQKSSKKSFFRKSRSWFGGALLLLVLAPLLIGGSSVALGAHLENNDAFCASCHTEPESTYVQRISETRNQSAPVKDLATFHAVSDGATRCIDCHSGGGLSGRIDAMKLGARDLSSYMQGNYAQPAPLTQAVSNSHCTKCHATYADDRSFNNHFHFLLPRWQQFQGDQAASCVDCHSSHTQDGQVQIAFLNEDRTVAQCNACHRILGD